MKALLGLAAFSAAILFGSSGFAAPTVQNAELVRLKQRLFPELSQLNLDGQPSAVRAMLTDRSKRREACAGEQVCAVTASVWSEAEIEALAQAASGGGEKGLALRTELKGVNVILKTYGLGESPRYAEIDGPDLFKRDVFHKNVGVAMRMVATQPSVQAADIDPSIGLSLALMDVADRLEVVRLEPQFEADNSAGFLRARKVNWGKYPYTVILALGVGPDDLQTPLSPAGKLNVQAAADLYFRGMAPFIIVSGSSVHPRRTQFVEAFEMRKALMTRYNIPGDAIIVDPLARHTTTNIRNASRLLKRMKAPLDRFGVIVSNESHITYVMSKVFSDRNTNELGYVPYIIGNRLSPTSVTFKSDGNTLLVDPRDPLDP